MRLRGRGASSLGRGSSASTSRREAEFALAGLPSRPYNERRQESA